MEKHTAYYELLKQLAQPACPVCALAARRTHAFLERYLEEGVVPRGHLGPPGGRGRLVWPPRHGDPGL